MKHLSTASAGALELFKTVRTYLYSSGFGLGQTRSVFEFLARKNPGTELVSRAGSDPNDVTNLPQRNLSNVTPKKSEYLRYS